MIKQTKFRCDFFEHSDFQCSKVTPNYRVFLLTGPALKISCVSR